MDVVVTVPLKFGLDKWIAEGDPAGKPWSGIEWDFYLGTTKPKISPGERVYVVYNGLLRGYAPLIRVRNINDVYYFTRRYVYSLVRHNQAVAVTIPEQIKGFRGFRYRWWDRDREIPFPDWVNPHAKIPEVACSK